ncbi:HDIG domain-containing protein [Tepiditoga spiralis]|uniref:HDIG domain-containing protein n=1 Tax=Tepiditoga spiralis TaxID=2108365 RepID=A0A7G1G4L4_9BACT|nr:HD domain-containing phosphohydrolase [Tepiditoga spiralis]BBE29954.1 HDIG domain-containing protein [Tepiditoga spiralis]
MFEYKLTDLIKIFQNLRINEFSDFLEHSIDVAKLSVSIAEELAPGKFSKSIVYFCGLMHDIGFLLKEIILENIDIDKDYILNYKTLASIEELDKKNFHSYLSASVLKYFKRFIPHDYLTAIENHHKEDNELIYESDEVKMLSKIFHVADKLSVIYRVNLESPEIGMEKMDEFIDNCGFFKTSIKNIINDDMNYLYLFDGNLNLKRYFNVDISLTLYEFMDFLKLISMIIDFRSPYTLNHTVSVSNVAKEIAKEMLDDYDANLLYMAGLMHDIGKIKTPLYILHKEGGLSYYEMNIMRKHVGETFRIFENFCSLKEIVLIASQHHEKLDGSGYPWGLSASQLSIGARILQIADMYVALREDRPYREGMSVEKALGIIEDMVEKNKLDKKVFDTLKNLTKEKELIKKYDKFIDEIEIDF